MGFKTLLFFAVRTQIISATFGGIMRLIIPATRGFLLAQILFILGVGSAAIDPAADILHKARVQMDAKSDQAHVVLKIIEPNGDVKSREMSLQILRTKEGFKSMIRLTSPADVKDTAVLAQMEGGQDQEWLYLPSSKQVRRIASSKKSTGILGSELSPEDLDPMAFNGAALTLEKQDATSAQISINPRKGTSEYTKVITTFSLPDALPRKTEYCKGASLEKTVAYSDYKTYGNIQRAQSIQIRNLKKNRGTDIEFSDITVNPHFVAKDFTPDALKSSW
jgi:uncharacterized protein